MPVRFTLTLLLLSLCGCGVGKGPSTEDMVARDVTLTAVGLFDNPNPLSQVPDGAFSRADDVVIRRPGFVETRRGFTGLAGTVGASTNRIDSMADFKGTLVTHWTDGTIASYQGGAWVAYAGTYQAPTGARMHFLQSAQSLYATTSMGVIRLDSLTGAWTQSGIPQALAPAAATSGTSGPLADNSAFAYRTVWGLRNANNRVLFGAPSGRATVSNGSSLATGTATNVSLTVPVPSWVTSAHFLQVYRSDNTGDASAVPSDELSLVNERYPTAGELTNGTLTFTDITPDALKGAYLYSNPTSGSPGSEKFQSPVCRDLEEYKDRVWGFCTTQRQRLNLTLLSVDSASGGMRDGDTITLFGGGATDTYSAGTTEDPTNNQFQRYTSGTPSQNVANTVKSLIRVLNKKSTALRAQYTSTEYSMPGMFLVEAANLGVSAFTVEMALGSSAYWSPAFNYGLLAALQRASGVVTGTTQSSRPHGFVVGQVINLYGFVNTGDTTTFPTGLKTITAVPSTTTFQYTEAGANASQTGSVASSFKTTFPALQSDPTAQLNGLSFGESEEAADAVPLGNYLTVGAANYAGNRVKRIGDTLLLFKDEATYMLTGDTPDTFSVREYPNPSKVVAPETVAKLGTSVYALTDQGVLAYTETGARLISGPIEGPIKALIAGDPTLAATVRSVAFALSYETEREWWLFLPTLATDTVATQAYVFNATNEAWTHWTLSANAGYVLPGQDVAYLAAPSANAALVERKTRTSADYQDATGVAITSAVDWAVRSGEDPTGYKTWMRATVNYEASGGTGYVANPDSVTMGCQTEVSPTRTSNTFDRGGLPFTASYIPDDCTRSQTLTFGVSAAQAQRRLSISGLSVDYLVSSSRVR